MDLPALAAVDIAIGAHAHSKNLVSGAGRKGKVPVYQGFPGLRRRCTGCYSAL
jgi:hypothetical protein